MQSRLKAQLARLGQVQAVSPNTSGSPAAVVLRPDPDGKAQPVTAMRLLVANGLTLLKARARSQGSAGAQNLSPPRKTGA